MILELFELPAGTIIEVIENGHPERYEITPDWKHEAKEDVFKVDEMVERHSEFRIISMPFEVTLQLAKVLSGEFGDEEDHRMNLLEAIAAVKEEQQ